VFHTPPILENFYVLSLSTATHAIDELADFPDSRTFYGGANKNRAILPGGVVSFLYMATCNRIEVYVELTTDNDPQVILTNLSTVFPEVRQIQERKPEILHGSAVLEHLIAVASGLQSIALGETQIAGQIKRDMANALGQGWLSAAMQTVLKKALETQKKIRNTTGISENSYSLMSLVENALRERKLRSIERTLILVGASEMSAKVARYALRRGVTAFVVVRKDKDRAMNIDMRDLIESHRDKFREITLAELKTSPSAIDADAIVLASTAAQPLIAGSDLAYLVEKRALSQNSAIVDLSLPQNVHDDVALHVGERLITLAALQKLSEAARTGRLLSAAEAAPIIRKALYQLWLDSLYRENSQLVRTYIEDKSNQSEFEWQRLASEAALSEKQKRILYDFMKKEQRRALADHREMILDLIASSRVLPQT